MMKKRRVHIAAGIVVLIGVLAGLVFTCYQLMMPTSNTPLIFSPETWDKQPYNRQRMISSLMEQYDDLRGMTRREISELLGNDRLSTDIDRYVVAKEKLWQPPTIMQLYYDGNGVFVTFEFFQLEH